MTRVSSYPKLYKFLKEQEQSKKSFTLEEVADYCGLKKNSVSKYFSEKLYNYYKTENNKYITSGITSLTYKEFERLICQRNPDKKA